MIVLLGMNLVDLTHLVSAARVTVPSAKVIVQRAIGKVRKTVRSKVVFPLVFSYDGVARTSEVADYLKAMIENGSATSTVVSLGLRLEVEVRQRDFCEKLVRVKAARHGQPEAVVNAFVLRVEFSTGAVLFCVREDLREPLEVYAGQRQSSLPDLGSNAAMNAFRASVLAPDAPVVVLCFIDCH